jgi:hypothetical protein
VLFCTCRSFVVRCVQHLTSYIGTDVLFSGNLAKAIKLRNREKHSAICPEISRSVTFEQPQRNRQSITTTLDRAQDLETKSREELFAELKAWKMETVVAPCKADEDDQTVQAAILAHQKRARHKMNAQSVRPHTAAVSSHEFLSPKKFEANGNSSSTLSQEGSRLKKKNEPARSGGKPPPRPTTSYASQSNSNIRRSQFEPMKASDHFHGMEYQKQSDFNMPNLEVSVNGKNFQLGSGAISGALAERIGSNIMTVASSVSLGDDSNDNDNEDDDGGGGILFFDSGNAVGGQESSVHTSPFVYEHDMSKGMDVSAGYTASVHEVQSIISQDQQPYPNDEGDCVGESIVKVRVGSRASTASSANSFLEHLDKDLEAIDKWTSEIEIAEDDADAKVGYRCIVQTSAMRSPHKSGDSGGSPLVVSLMSPRTGNDTQKHVAGATEAFGSRHVESKSPTAAAISALRKRGERPASASKTNVGMRSYPSDGENRADRDDGPSQSTASTSTATLVNSFENTQSNTSKVFPRVSALIQPSATSMIDTGDVSSSTSIGDNSEKSNTGGRRRRGLESKDKSQGGKDSRDARVRRRQGSENSILKVEQTGIENSSDKDSEDNKDGFRACSRKSSRGSSRETSRSRVESSGEKASSASGERTISYNASSGLEKKKDSQRPRSLELGKACRLEGTKLAFPSSIYT